MLQPPPSHKALAAYLRDRLGGPASVSIYRDNQGRGPTPIGSFGAAGRRFHSTIGVFERQLPVPPGIYELAACGSPIWLPNALASSLYWLKARRADTWPLVCEDVVKDNASSVYRHMAYVPSDNCFELSPGLQIRWLLGLPIRDDEVALSLESACERANAAYPDWLATKSSGAPALRPPTGGPVH